MKLIFKGKNAIVAGASGGMGLEISKILSKNNINVLMLDIQNPGKTFLSNNVNCIYKKVDVTNFNKDKQFINKKGMKEYYLKDKKIVKIKSSIKPVIPKVGDIVSSSTCVDNSS